MDTAGVERQPSHVWWFERCGRVRRRVGNGCLEVEAVQNSSTTKTRRQRNGQPGGSCRLGDVPDSPMFGTQREGRGDRGSDKISFTPPN